MAITLDLRKTCWEVSVICAAAYLKLIIFMDFVSLLSWGIDWLQIEEQSSSVMV